MFFPIVFGRRASMASRARVLKGSMLQDPFFWNLLFKCHSMEEIALQLQKSSSYGEYLENRDISDIHRFQLESILSLVPFREADRFRYLAGTRRWNVIDKWRRSSEVDLLKKIIRHVYSGGRDPDVLQEKAEIMGKISFPAGDLLECSSLEEVVQCLVNTPYHEVLKGPVEKMGKGKGTLFSVEMALDGYMLERVFRSVDMLHGREKKALHELYGTRADLLNLYWLYRSRKYFDMSPEEMVSRIVPHRFHLGKRQLRKLIFAPDLEGFLDLLQKTWYGKYIEYPEDMDRGSLELVLERSLNRIIYKKAKRIFLSGVPGVHTVIAYLVLREFEVKDIITIIEDVRYDLSRRMAVLFLVREMGSEEAS